MFMCAQRKMKSVQSSSTKLLIFIYILLDTMIYNFNTYLLFFIKNIHMCILDTKFQLLDDTQVHIMNSMVSTTAAEPLDSAFESPPSLKDVKNS
jgi:hypothetical protein